MNPDKTVRLFFLLSGENETLPAAEVTAILEAENYPYKNKQLLDQVLLLDSDIESVDAVQLRTAYTRVCAREFFTCNAMQRDIAQCASSIDFTRVLREGESFAVRINRIKTYAEKLNTMTLERELGKYIQESTQRINTRVDLKSPDKTFIGILTSERLVFGLKLTEITTKTFSERRPRKKPFFHPSAMPSKLARCMTNLAHAKADRFVLDPFCGTGSTLIEATYIGCKALGVDAQKRMIVGCKKNLSYFHISAEGLVLADARKLPFTKVDCVVTDPPYGRSASTLKSTTKQLVEAVLSSTYDLLTVGQRICIASPKTLHIRRIGKNLGFKHLESHFAYVHRTLTREIAVFEKT